MVLFIYYTSENHQMHLKCCAFNTAYQGIQDHSEVMKEDVKELDGKELDPLLNVD